MKNSVTRAVTFITAIILTVSCGTGPKQKTIVMDVDNSLTQQEINAGIFTPEVMWKMGRVGSSSISPDGKDVVYTVTYYDVEGNNGNSSLYLIPVDGGDARRLTDSEGHDYSPVWSSDGKRIYFMSNRSGSDQAWMFDPVTTDMFALTNLPGGIEGFGISPSEKHMFYIKKVKVEDKESSDIYTDLKKSKALIYDDLMARHWNYWDRGEYSHIFITEMQFIGEIAEGIDIMPGEPWDAPMAPYFDNTEIAWNNAGTKLAYTCKKTTGTEYAESTDSDIFVYDLISGETDNITQGMVGYDKYPVFSPDDSKLAFQSMRRPGNESDKDRLFVHDLQTGEKTYLTENFDYNAYNIVWDGNDAIMFISPISGTRQICRATLGTHISILTYGDHDINAFSMANRNIVCEKTQITMATELFKIGPELFETPAGVKNKEKAPSQSTMIQLTNVNSHVYDNIKMGEVQKRWVRTTDGKDMLTWVVLPPDFDASKKYPVLLYCQGGPQNVVSQFWSYRWNFQLMAAQGYIVVAPNRRGLPSFGQEWLDQISGDYSGQNIKDYLSAIDDVAKEPWADETRMGCVGASYGGYSAFYLAGNHNKRFKAFIAHCGIFNFESMYGETEELFFVNNDYGGSYWSNNPVAKRSYANSPHKFVQKWDSPILIITGLNDFRIPYTQSLQAFTAAKLMGLPSRLVAFEDEAHQVFKPQNSLVWNREFFNWLDQYVKNAN